MQLPVGQIRRPAGEHVVAVAHVQRQPVVDEGLAHPLVVLELGRGLHGVVVEAVLFQPVARRAAHGLDLRRVLAGQPLVQQVGQQTVVAVPVLAALALETLDEQVVLYQEVHLRRHFRAREPRDALGHRQTEGIDHRRAGQETLPFRLQNREHLFEQVVVDAALCAFDGFAHLALRSVAAQKRHQLAAGNPPLRRFLYGLRFVLRKPYAQLREQRARLFQGKAQMGLGHLHQLARHLHLGGGKVQRLARRDDEVRVGGQMLHQVTHAFADVLAGAHLVEVLKHAHEVAPVFGDLENEVVEHGTHVLEAAGQSGPRQAPGRCACRQRAGRPPDRDSSARARRLRRRCGTKPPARCRAWWPKTRPRWSCRIRPTSPRWSTGRPWHAKAARSPGGAQARSKAATA